MPCQTEDFLPKSTHRCRKCHPGRVEKNKTKWTFWKLEHPCKHQPGSSLKSNLHHARTSNAKPKINFDVDVVWHTEPVDIEESIRDRRLQIESTCILSQSVLRRGKLKLGAQSVFTFFISWMKNRLFGHKKSHSSCCSPQKTFQGSTDISLPFFRFMF